MRKVSASLYFLMLLILCESCEKEAVNIELPKADPKLVIYSYLSPSDSLIEVEITKSAPFFGKNSDINEFEFVEDATVQISSNGITLNIPFNNLTGRYSIPNNSSFPIVEGRSYSLFVTAPGGFVCSANTSVPSVKPNGIRIELDSSFKEDEFFSEKKYRIIAKWNDVAGSLNYYHHAVRIGSESRFDGGFNICDHFISSEDKEGEEISRTCTYNVFSSFEPPSSKFNGTVFLLTTDVSYYKYHESLFRNDDENPFAEPVQTFSNIEGGLGCFGSYVEQRAEINP